jgi:ribosome-associated translation inhibitor RaiA
MQVPIEIDFDGMQPSEFIAQRIRERARKLEHRFDRIVSCRVTVQAPRQRHNNRGNLYNVRIALHVPGAALAINRDPGQDRAHRDLYIAIRDAFDIAERRLEEYVRKMRTPAGATE